MAYDSGSVRPEDMQTAIVALGYRPSIASSRVDLGEMRSIETPALIQEALVDARESDRLLLIDFHAPWCGACRKLEETTLVDSGVQAALEEFVFVKIDTDEHPEIGKHFGVLGLPTIVALDSSGDERYRHVGPIDAAALTNVLASLMETKDNQPLTLRPATHR